MKYNISNIDQLLADTKKLDICNDAKHIFEGEIQKHSKCCLHCRWFSALYEGSCDTLGVCLIHNRATSFYKSLVPGWAFCNYYEIDKLKLLQEAKNG